MKLDNDHRVDLGLLCFICCTLLMVAACKDEKPTLLLPVNEAEIAGIDSVYVVDPGATLHLDASVTFTNDEAPDSANYRYEWFMIRSVGFVGDGYKLVGVGKALEYSLPNNQGAFDLLFRVTDTRTNLFSEQEFRVFVANDLYEGWLLLGQHGNEYRLDMLSYQLDSRDFIYIENVLDEYYPGARIAEQATFVDFSIAGFFNMYIGGVVLGTKQNVYAYDVEDMGYMGAFGSFLPDLGPADFAKLQYGGRLYSAFINTGSQVYVTDYGLSSPYPKFNKVNQLREADGRITSFSAAPQMAIQLGYPIQQTAVLFDEEAHELLWFNSQNQYANRFGQGRLFNYKTGKNLTYLGYCENAGGQYVALLRDTATHTEYLARFSIYDQQYYQAIEAPEIEHATQFALRPSDGALFYVAGSRLYVVDQPTNKAVLLKDFGSVRISKIKFNSFITIIPSISYAGTTASEVRYRDLQEQLIVCVYDPLRPDNSGSFLRYDVDTDRRELHEAFRFDGLPKIIDVVYKER